MRTGFRNHGYYGHTFVGARVLSGIALLAIIGLVATFTSQINKASLAPPVQLTGAIIVSAAALLWVLLSFTAYDDTHIPYMATAIVDTLFLIPFVVVVIILGGQLSKTECSTLPEQSGTLQLDPADTAGNGTLSFVTFAASDRMTCFKLQGTWGLSIALCILFLLSALAAAFMFMGKRKNGYKGKFFGKHSARIGKGKPIKGYKSPETWTSQNVNSTRSAGPGSPKKNKKSKQKKQQQNNGQNQASSYQYDKGYSFFKPSTWYSSNKSSANSSSSTSRGMNNPGSSGNSSSARNVNMNNQAPDLSPSKNNTEPPNGSNETTGKWIFGFGRFWRKGGGRRDGRDRSKNTAPPGHQQEDIVFTDVPRGRRSDPNTTNSNNNRDLGGPQGESKGKGFLGLFRSKNTSPQTNRSLDPQGRSRQPVPPNSNQAVNPAGQLQDAAYADEDMPGKRQVPPAFNGRGNGRPGPNAAGKGPQPPLAGSSSKGMMPNSFDNTKAGAKNGMPPQRQGGPAPPLTKGPNMPPAALQRGRGIAPAAPIGKNNAGMADLNNPKANPNLQGKNVAGAPGQRTAPGATIGNLNQDGSRNMGFQRGQPQVQNAAGYTPPADIRKPGAALNPGPNGQNLQRKQNGLNETKPPMPGQPLPPNRNGQPLRPGENAIVTKDEPSVKPAGGLFSNLKNPLKPTQEKRGNDSLPNPSTYNLPSKQNEGRGPLMPDPKNSARPAPGQNAAGQQNPAPFNTPAQQDESRGLQLPGRGKKGAAPPPKGAQQKVDRIPSAAEDAYFNTPLGPAAQEATRRGKTRAEKKGELETKPPVKQPHRLHPQRNSFESEAPVTAAGNVPPNKQGKQPAAIGRPEPPVGRNAQPGLPPQSAPQPERDAKGRLLPEALRRPGPAGSEGKPNLPGQPAPSVLPTGQSGKDQVPPPQTRDGQDMRAGEGPSLTKDIKGGLPPRDEKGRPAPPPLGRGPHGGEQPMLDERGRPLPQRVAGGPGVPAALAPGGKNPRDAPTMQNEPKQPVPSARDERGRPRGPATEPAVLNALAPGRNPRDERGAPPPQKPGVQGRDIPNALLPGGGRPSQESVRDAKAPGGDRRQPSPPSDGPRRPGSPRNGSGRRQSPPGRGRAPSPSNMRVPRGTEKRQDELFTGDVRSQNVDKNGRPMPPFAEKPLEPQPAQVGDERGRGRQMPPAVAASGELPQPPPSLRDPRKEAPAARGIPPVPPQNQPPSRDGRPMPPMPASQDQPLGSGPPSMRNDRGRPVPPPAAGERALPPAALSNADAARERSRSRPPPMLKDRQSFFQPGMPFQDSNAAPMPGTRGGPPPREPGMANLGAPLRDDSRGPRVDERNMPANSKAPINPWEKKSNANNIPAPFGNSFNDTRQPPSDSRDLRGQQGPRDVEQPPLPVGTKPDGRSGQAPPFPPREQQMNGKAGSSTSSRDMNAGKLDTNVTSRNTPSAEPSSATESPSKAGGLLGRLFGKKNKKQAEAMPTSNIPTEPMAKRPSLLPPGRERQSIGSNADAAAPAAAGGVAQPDQRGRAPFSQHDEARPEQQGRDLTRGPNSLSNLQDGGDNPRKTLIDTSIPHSRDGMKRAPSPPPPVRESRGRASPFPMRPGQKPSPPMPPAANNPNELISASVPARDLSQDKQEEPKMPEPREQKKMNRKSHVLAGMVPPMPGQNDTVPAVSQTLSSYKNGDERSIPGDSQMPPVPVLDDKQRRAANRKSHMNGFGPADIQMPPVPNLPEQSPAHKDDVTSKSDLPSSLRPGVSDGAPQGQRDLMDDSAKETPGMVHPPPMGLRRGLPSRPTPRGAAKERGRPTERGIPPLAGAEMDRSDLKLDTKNGEQFPPAPGSIPAPLSESRDMGPDMSGMPDSPKSKMAKRGKDQNQTRQPLSPLDGNMPPRSPLGAGFGDMPPSLQKPSSPRSNKLKDIFGNAKGKDGASRKINSPTIGNEKPLSPTSRPADIEKEMDSISSSRPMGGDKEQLPARFSDSSFTDDMLNTPPMVSNAFVSDKDTSSKDIYGKAVKDAREPIADNNVAPFSSLKGEKASKKKAKSRGLPGDDQDESAVKEDTKRDFLGGIFGGKDQMSPMGSPTFKDDEPWAAGKDADTPRDKKPGFFDFGSDKNKKDKKLRRGSRGSAAGSQTFMDDAPCSPGQDEIWSTNGDAFDEKTTGDKKTNGLFGRGKDKTKSPTDEKHGLFGFGKGKDKKNKSGSPLGSPTLKDSSAVSPGFESFSTDEDGVPGSKEKGTGFFDKFGRDKKQRRGSKSRPLSPDRESMLLDSTDGQLDEEATGEKKSGLRGLFSKDKDGKNKPIGSNTEPLSPGKHDSVSAPPSFMDEQQIRDNDQNVIPALLVVQKQSQPGSPVLPGQENPGQFEAHSVDGDNDLSIPAEEDKKSKMSKGLFGFGNNKNGDERSDDIYDDRMDRPSSPHLENRNSFLSPIDDTYNDQDSRPLSPQNEYPTSPDMDKKDKKGKGFFGRFGKSKDGDLTPTSLDGFSDHDGQTLSPEMGNKDKDGKSIFGWGKKKNRDSPRLSPVDDDFNHGGMSPHSPGMEFDQRQSGDMKSFASPAQSPMLEDSMASPRRSFDGGNSPPLYADEEPLSPAEPEKLRPAPLDLKGKMRKSFDNVGGVEGEERDDGKPGSPYSPPPGGEYSTNNMPPSPAAGMDDFGGNNSVPPSPARGMDKFGGGSMPPSPTGGMEADAAPMPMESPVQSEFGAMSNGPASPQPDMGMPSPAQPEFADPVVPDEPELIATDSGIVDAPPAQGESRDMGASMDPAAMDNLEPAADARAFSEPVADDFGGAPGPADDFSEPTPMAEEFGGNSGPVDDFAEPAPAFDDFGGDSGPPGGFDEPAPMADDFGGDAGQPGGFDEPAPALDDFGGDPPPPDAGFAEPEPVFDAGGDDFGNDGFDAGMDRGLDMEPGQDFEPEPEIPMDDMPADDIPMDDMPMDDMPPDDMPMDDTPMDEMPIDDMPPEDMPPEDMPPEEFGDNGEGFDEPPAFDDGGDRGLDEPFDEPFDEPPFEEPPFEEPPFEEPLDEPIDEFNEEPLPDDGEEIILQDDFGTPDEPGDFEDGDRGFDEEPPFEEAPFEEAPFEDAPFEDAPFDEEAPLEEGMMDEEFMDDMEGDGDRGLDEDMMDGEEMEEEMMGDEFGEGEEMEGEEFTGEEEFPEEEFLEGEGEGEGMEAYGSGEEGGEGEEDRGLDDEALEDEEGQDEEDGLDDDELQDIMNDGDEAPGSDLDRGMDSAGLEEPENEQEQEDEAVLEEQAGEAENTNDVRLSQLYRQSAVLFSAGFESPLPPSPPPEQEPTIPQNEDLDSTDPIRYSHLYRQSVDLDVAMTLQSPDSDGGLSAVAESPNMEQEQQSFDVPVLAPVPDFAKRRSERLSARISTISQPLSPIAASLLSPRPPVTPPPEEDEAYNDQADQHKFDPNYDVERALTPEEEYENYYDEDDEYEPHDKSNSGPSGPQTFDDMNLSPRPGPSPSERYSYHEDLEQGPPMTPFTPNGNRKTLRERMSGWWAQGSGNGQEGSNYTPPPPMPYDNGQFI